MDPNLEDVIAAFVDGEPVAADELRSALALDEAREYLIDLVALRGLVRPVGAAEIAPAMAGHESGAPAARPAPRPRLVWTAAAAALVAISTLAGFAAGRMGRIIEVPQNPPTVTMQAIPPAFAVPAPAPTRVIQLQHGKEWTEQAGGN
jgi:hypothetical protein